MKHPWRLAALLAVFLVLRGGFAMAAPVDSEAADALIANSSQLNRPYYTLSGGWSYTLLHEVSVKNIDRIASVDIVVTVPLMDEETPLYVQKQNEQLQPWPDEIREESNGRRVAVYRIDRLDPGEELLITQKYLVQTNSIGYVDLLAFGDRDFENDRIDERYLNPETNIQSNHVEIRNFALEAVTYNGREEQNPYQRAKDAFSAVNRHMTYLRDEHANGSALSALRRGTGVCEDYANLYVAVLRALGIPARVMSGYLYQPSDHLREPYLDLEHYRIDLYELRHTWVEFYVAGLGWVVADPTFTYSFESGGEVQKFINWDYFEKITDSRRYLYFREGDGKNDRVHYDSHPLGGNLDVDMNYYLYMRDQTSLFNDTEGHWAESDIAYLYNYYSGPLMQGTGEGLFGINQSLTRAQMVVTLQRYMQSPSANAQFNDVSHNHWAFREIGAAQVAGWANGYPDQTFRPELAVTRAELAQMLVNVFDLRLPVEGEALEEPLADDPEADTPEEAEQPPEEAETSDGEPDQDADEEDEEQAAELPTLPLTVTFLDLGQEGYAWADEAILILARLGLAEGTGGGYFQPQRVVTRAEFAALLARTLVYVEQLSKPL